MRNSLAIRFSDRAELTPDEFYQQYYEKSGLPKNLTIETLNLMARALSIQAGLLRPTDGFTVELKPTGLFSNNEFDELIWELDILLNETGRDWPELELINIDEYIRFVVELRQMQLKCNKNTPI
ncbi:MAG: hypothetical protein L7F77_09445 [Candidatus Magnetominusculus sp. LBB02]|nr:hypothetical protein [Candidatus Magnetominusculus sp. LBB02]